MWVTLKLQIFKKKKKKKSHESFQNFAVFSMKFDDILSYYKEFSDITNALISQKVDNIQLISIFFFNCCIFYLIK